MKTASLLLALLFVVFLNTYKETHVPKNTEQHNEANLVSPKDTLYVSTFMYEALALQVQKVLSLVEVGVDSLAGLLEIMVSSKIFTAYTGQALGQVLFCFALNNIPRRNPAAYN